MMSKNFERVSSESLSILLKVSHHLFQGAKSRNKTLVVTGISKDDVVNKLQTEIDS